MRQRSKSTLFLIEQLIVIAVFALCATACVRIQSTAYFYQRDSKDISNALLVAQSGAESLKAVSGNFAMVAEILGGVAEGASGTSVVVYYDSKWHVCGPSDASYVLRIVGSGAEPASAPLLTGELSVEKTTGEGLVSFTVITGAR